MKKIYIYAILGLTVFSLAACAHLPENMPAPTVTSMITTTPLPTSTTAPGQRVSLEDACIRISALLPDADMEIREITTDTLWEELGVQLFTNAAPEQYEYVFAVAGDSAIILKEFWGSYYFDYALADMDGDGQKEMLFVYNWGSGIVRSEMGILKSGGSIVEITSTEEAEGLWLIHTLKTEHDAVTCEMTSAMGESGTKRGICTYKNGEYVFYIEE